MCRCSELSVAGFIRPQRLVGQEVAASLLTVRRLEHDFDSTAVAVRGRNDINKGWRSMPTTRDLRSGRGRTQTREERYWPRSLRSGPMPSLPR